MKIKTNPTNIASSANVEIQTFFLFFLCPVLSKIFFTFFSEPGCPRPMNIAQRNGQFLESYRGAVVKVVCNPGYSLVGSPSVYCDGFRWNGSFPLCDGKYKIYRGLDKLIGQFLQMHLKMF